VGRLRELPNIAVVVAAVGLADEEVWALAQSEEAAILTGNVVDFLRLAVARPDHHGVLLVYRSNDPTRDLRAADIAAAVESIVNAYPDGFAGLTLVVNGFRERPVTRRTTA
jgi:hypothetical protein